MINENLIALNNPKSPAAEAYRIIRTNIQFSCVDLELKKLLVTSSGPSEGKTTTAANLAVTFAQAGKKVILLDADLRKPKQHKIFGLPNYQGLTNLLLGETETADVLNDTPLDLLKVITTGPIPPNPAEMLGSKRMEALLINLEQMADLVIIDTPPVIAVTDAALLASKVEATVLVVAANQTRIEAAQKSKELLNNVKANIIGTILNMVEEDSEDYYYYYSYYLEGSSPKRKKVKSKKPMADSAASL